MRKLALALCLLALGGAADPVGAEVFTVAAGESIQAAVDEAVAAGGDNEIRVAAGIFVGQVSVDSLEAGSLALSGGWLPASTRA
jgi:pectin methylesterase-like acyl-CoA thioesterase